VLIYKGNKQRECSRTIIILCGNWVIFNQWSYLTLLAEGGNIEGQQGKRRKSYPIIGKAYQKFAYGFSTAREFAERYTGRELGNVTQRFFHSIGRRLYI
jgi:hypothetical protein